MEFRRLWLPLVLVGLVATGARAQHSTAVQLPTYSYFGTSTTVSVPDRGSVYMGGINRASSGSNQYRSPLLPFAPLGNRAIGSSRGASSTRVSVWIHDFEAMDEYLLSQPTPFRAGPAGAADPWPRRLAEAQDARNARPAAGSPDPKLNSARNEKSRRAEAVTFFERGLKAEAGGKANVARIYYQMASRRATGELKQRVLARLELVNAAKIAGNR